MAAPFKSAICSKVLRWQLFENSASAARPHGVRHSRWELTLLNRACWASACACTAINAGISSNFIFSIASRDSAYWTFPFTCSTAYTSVSNYVCHTYFLLINDKWYLSLQAPAKNHSGLECLSASNFILIQMAADYK